jgi:hypothetical protein
MDYRGGTEVIKVMDYRGGTEVINVMDYRGDSTEGFMRYNN